MPTADRAAVKPEMTTTVNHRIKFHLGLTESAYSMAWVVWTEADPDGWCHKTLADLCRKLYWINEQGEPKIMTAMNNLHLLERQGLLVSNGRRKRGKLWRVTHKWLDAQTPENT